MVRSNLPGGAGAGVDPSGEGEDEDEEPSLREVLEEQRRLQEEAASGGDQPPPGGGGGGGGGGGSPPRTGGGGIPGGPGDDRAPPTDEDVGTPSPPDQGDGGGGGGGGSPPRAGPGGIPGGPGDDRAPPTDEGVVTGGEQPPGTGGGDDGPPSGDPPTESVASNRPPDLSEVQDLERDPDQGLEDERAHPDLNRQARELERDFLEGSDVFDDPDQVRIVERDGQLVTELTATGEQALQEHAGEQSATFEGPRAFQAFDVEQTDEEFLINLSEWGEQELQRQAVESSPALDELGDVMLVEEDGEFSIALTEQGEAAIEQLEQRLGMNPAESIAFSVGAAVEGAEETSTTFEPPTEAERLSERIEATIGAAIVEAEETAAPPEPAPGEQRAIEQLAAFGATGATPEQRAQERFEQTLLQPIIQAEQASTDSEQGADFSRAFDAEFLLRNPSVGAGLFGTQARERAIEQAATEGSLSGRVFVGGESIEQAGVEATRWLDQWVPRGDDPAEVTVRGADGEVIGTGVNLNPRVGIEIAPRVEAFQGENVVIDPGIGLDPDAPRVGTQLRNVAIGLPAGAGFLGGLGPKAAGSAGLRVEEFFGRDVEPGAFLTGAETVGAAGQAGATIGAGILEQPVGTAADLALPVATGVGLGRGGRAAVGRVRTLGREEIPVEQLVRRSVLEGEENFPMFSERAVDAGAATPVERFPGRAAADPEVEFRAMMERTQGPFEEPGVIHATDQPFPRREFEIQASPRPEEPDAGFFAPEASVHFTRVTSPESPGFEVGLPNLGIFDRPTMARVTPERVGRAPADVRTAADMTTFLQSELGSGGVFLRSESRITPEAEALVAGATDELPGARFVQTEGRFFTSIEGQRIPINEFVPESQAGAVARQGGEFAPASQEPVFITEISSRPPSLPPTAEVAPVTSFLSFEGFGAGEGQGLFALEPDVADQGPPPRSIASDAPTATSGGALFAGLSSGFGLASAGEGFLSEISLGATTSVADSAVVATSTAPAAGSSGAAAPTSSLFGPPSSSIFSPPSAPPSGPPTGPPTAPPSAPPSGPPSWPPSSPPSAPPTVPPVGPPTVPPVGPPTVPPGRPPRTPDRNRDVDESEFEEWGQWIDPFINPIASGADVIFGPADQWFVDDLGWFGEEAAGRVFDVADQPGFDGPELTIVEDEGFFVNWGF